MTQPLEFRFALTRDEFVRGMRAFYLRQRSTWIFLGVFILFVIAQLILIRPSPMLLLLMGLLPIAVYLGALFLFIPWLMGRNMQRNERMRMEMTWRVSDERIAVSTPHADSSMDWGTFRRVIITPESYLLVFSINKNMFQIVPKRALETPERASAFEQLLVQKLGQPRRASA